MTSRARETTYEENIELFLKTAMSRADQTHVMKLWYEGLLKERLTVKFEENERKTENED